MRRSALVAATDGVAGHSLMKLLQPCRLIKDVWLRDTSGPPAFARLVVRVFFFFIFFFYFSEGRSMRIQ